jgi:galactosylceramidase
MVPSVGYGWGTTQQRTQTLIPGPMTWNNYELSSDVYIENGEIYLAVRRGFPSWSWEGMTSGYSFVLEKNGGWALHFDQPDDDSNRLINGTIANFDGSLWHNVKVRSVDEKIEASVDGAKLFTITDSQRSSGNASIGGTFDSNQFDNISVRKTGRQWNVINQIDSSITWVEYWWYYAGSWFFNGDCSYTSTTNASATFPFSGVAGRVIGTKRSDCGILDVYVDDVYKTSVDCYSETEDNGQILYETEDLSSGNHTIKVVVTGQKNAASSNPQIILGGFSSTTAIACSTVKTNFALTATASASSIWDSGYTAAMANDGDVISRWNSAGNDVNGSWLEMDFGQEVTFNKTKLTQLDNRIQSYKIQYDDGQWKDAYTGGQLGTGSTDSFPAVTGTKVRLYVVSATAVPSIYEFEVYSAQTDFDDDGRVNFADLAWLCTRWLEDDCDQSCDCQGADVYRDGTVDLQDFSVFFEEYNP